jgi:hypothetical protein
MFIILKVEKMKHSSLPRRNRISRDKKGLKVGTLAQHHFHCCHKTSPNNSRLKRSNEALALKRKKMINFINLPSILVVSLGTWTPRQ